MLRQGLVTMLQAVVLVACASATELFDSRPCEIRKHCTVEGPLGLHAGYPGSVGVIRGKAWCVALALDKAIHRERDRWDGKLVRASGMAYEQPIELSWYELDGRRVALGVCDSGPVIYVEKIEQLRR